MKTLGKYKHLIAVVLSALYGFIATPVQLWHQHSAGLKNLAPAIRNKGGDVLYASSTASTEANCPVCCHKYAASNDDAIQPFELLVPTPGPMHAHYCIVPVTSPFLPLPNKGLPCILG